MRKNQLFILLNTFCLILFICNIGYANIKPIKGFYFYKIQKGDTLSKIALRKNWDLIMRINRTDSYHLQEGRNILLPINSAHPPSFCPIPLKMKIFQKKPRSICVFLHNQYFGAYAYGSLVFWGPISSGKNISHKTPTGLFYIRWKAKNYFSHSQECFGAPMPYSLNLSNTGYFLHEQSLPGKPASHGCVRLLRIDAKKLFRWSQIGDPVIIAHSF